MGCEGRIGWDGLVDRLCSRGRKGRKKRRQEERKEGGKQGRGLINEVGIF